MNDAERHGMLQALSKFLLSLPSLPDTIHKDNAQHLRNITLRFFANSNENEPTMPSIS
jgi:hypothetical protein